MKSKIKKFINSKLFVFIIIALVFSTIGVSAATYFASSQVTYDNKTSGLKSTDVQGAIDELYNECFPPIIDQLIDSLGKDPYECRYFFQGANPNNYIRFNNELWRIISVECDGTIKIMRNDSIGNMAWGSSSSNNWARPASLNTYLNGDYLTSTLNSIAQSQIVAKDWSIGGETVDSQYDLAEQINDENSSKWNGKVALITTSEYIRSNSNKGSCGTLNKNEQNYKICQSTTWMFNGVSWWMLTTNAHLSNNVSIVRNDGYINSYDAKMTYGVRPVVYLSSNVQITGGSGSSSNPYAIT